MGLVMTALAKSYDFFTYWFTLVLTPQMLLCGVFFPLGAAGVGAGRRLALPLTHAIALGRPLFLGGSRRRSCCTWGCCSPTPSSRSRSRWC